MSRVKHATARRYPDGREILAHVWGYLLGQRVKHRWDSHRNAASACVQCRDLDLAAHLVLGTAVEAFGVDLDYLRKLCASGIVGTPS